MGGKPRPILRKRIGKDLANLRKARHWSQAHVARIIGVKQPTISRIEKGDGTSFDVLEQLLELYKADLKIVRRR